MRLSIGRRPLYLGLLITGIAMIGVAWTVLFGGRTNDLLFDLGVEVIGLGLTVSILDWFFERRRLLGEARRLAWELYYAIERVAWVWQGGPRRLDTDEVVGLLGSARPEDALSTGTESLVYALAVRSRQILKGEHDTVEFVPKLHTALEALGALTSVRRGDRRPLHPHRVSETLGEALGSVLAILQLEPSFVPDRLIRHRDPAPEAQVTRYETELRAHAPLPG